MPLDVTGDKLTLVRLWFGTSRQQTITSTNIDPDLCRHITSLCHQTCQKVTMILTMTMTMTMVMVIAITIIWLMILINIIKIPCITYQTGLHTICVFRNTLDCTAGLSKQITFYLLKYPCFACATHNKNLLDTSWRHASKDNHFRRIWPAIGFFRSCGSSNNGLLGASIKVSIFIYKY